MNVEIEHCLSRLSLVGGAARLCFSHMEGRMGDTRRSFIQKAVALGAATGPLRHWPMSLGSQPESRLPPLRQVAPVKRLTPADFADPNIFTNRFGRRITRMQAAPQAITAGHRSALVPYAVRAVLDASLRRPLTRLQAAVAKSITNAGLEKKLLARFRSLPTPLGAALGTNAFSAPTGAEADAWLFQTFRAGAAALEPSLNRNRLLLDGAFGQTVFITGGTTFADWIAQHPAQQQQCTDLYQARLEYRGITTHTAGDRWGGVEPYLVTGVYRIPGGSTTVEELGAPMVVKQDPSGLDSMPANNWEPSGGSQDAAGNPSNPIQFFPKVCETHHMNVFGVSMPYQVCGSPSALADAPVLLGSDKHYAVISVWEEDGDESSQVMQALGSAMLSAGSELLSAVPPAAPGAIVMIALGAILDLASYFTASSDDSIGNFVILLDNNTLGTSGYREISYRVQESGGSNDWTIWLGLESHKKQ